MRILALLSVLIALASVSLVTATAFGQDDTRPAPAPEFGAGFPRLMPMTTPEPAASPAKISRGGIDQLAVAGAAYWLLLGGVALRRSRRRYSVSTAA